MSGRFCKGHKPWNKGRIRLDILGSKHPMWKGGLPKCPRCGKELSRRESRMCITCFNNTHKGDKHPCWQGGKTIVNVSIRNSLRYRLWRSDVFTRDNFTCQHCGDTKTYFEAHHIEAFNTLIKRYHIMTLEEGLRCEALWNINNGVTLCEKCHNHTKPGRLKS